MAQDPRRRRPEDEQAQGGGVAGPNLTPGMMAPYFQGTPTYDYSGIQGQGGLMAFLQAQSQDPGRGMGPAGRHLRNVGMPADFPGMDTQMDVAPPGQAIGGPNVAPGAPNGLAIGQSGMLPPGIERQQAGLQNTQGWRNLAPGYAIAAGAGFGTEAFDRFMGGNMDTGVRPQAGGPRPGGQQDSGQRAVGATADAPGPRGAGGGPRPAPQMGPGPGGPVQNPGRPGGATDNMQGTVRGGSQNTPGVGGPQLSESERARGVGRRPGTGSAAGPGSAGTSADTARNRMGPSSGGAPATGGTGTSAGTNRRVGGPTAQTPPPVTHFAPDPRGSGTAPIGRRRSSGGSSSGKATSGGLAARRA